MYNVLLADDEMLDLEGMKQFIPWSSLGMEVVGAVTNGFSACEIMEKQRIDILVTDVNMPNMSGLELARRAIDHNSDIRVIFVSGYQDFHYVKQALSLNACSYVLKPMDDTELVSSLEKVKTELDHEKQRRKAEETYQHMIPMAKNEYLMRVFEGELGLELDDNQTRLAISYGLNDWSVPLLVAILELDDRNRRQSVPVSLHKQAGFMEVFEEVCNLYGVKHICKLSQQRIAVLIDPEQVEIYMAELSDQIHTKFNLMKTVGLGQSVNNLQNLHQSYQQALEAIGAKMFLGKGKVINYEQLHHSSMLIDVEMLDGNLSTLFKSIINYELVQIHDEIENLFHIVGNLRSKFTIHNLSIYIVWKLDQQLQTRNENLFDLLGIDIQKLDVLLQFDTIMDIKSWLVRHSFHISEELHMKLNSKNNKLVREIMKKMEEQMNENMTLKDIAFQFSFSPNYLGFLFKEEVGKTFSEVLLQLRMERARELLQDPTLKIYEVADQVGYSYVPHFSKQFKETYGMTPMELRKRS